MNHTQLSTANKQALGQPERKNWRRPRYQVAESEAAFQVAVTVPGVNREGVDISVQEDTLTIVGTRIHSQPEGWRPLLRELSEDNYRLRLRLNVAVKESEIQAKLEDGILELTLPKAEAVKPRKIQVS